MVLEREEMDPLIFITLIRMWMFFDHVPRISS
jgi:hypothetical protein